MNYVFLLLGHCASLRKKSITTIPLMCRLTKQRLREARIQAVDYLILLLAGVCLGTLAKVSDETFGALGYTYTVIAVCKSLMIEMSSLHLESVHMHC